MNPRTLDEWLRWLEALHPRAIQLGLDRVRAVADRLGLDGPGCPVVTVGGTNGKGSCVAYLETILAEAGYRVGTYSSPHLLRFNERVRVAREEARDAELVAAFARVEAARRGTSLTYFEFTTLAAVDLFGREGLDVAVLEVGLGGRLDAVNLFDAEVALITTVAHDHTDWLGEQIEEIAREKAGILRPGRPAVYGDAEPPRALLERARALGARLALAGTDYAWSVTPEGWEWRGGETVRAALPAPGISGLVQHANAAAVLMVLEFLAPRLPVDDAAVRRGLAGASLAGRFQVLPGAVPRVLDVAHNVQAAECLARNLRANPVPGRTRMVLAMLGDKDHAGVLGALAPVTDAWYLAGLAVARGAGVEVLRERARAAGLAARTESFPDVAGAYRAAMAAAVPGDRIVVCGSFFTVAAVLALESGPG